MDLEALRRQFEPTPQQTQSAFEVLAPVVAAGVRRNTSSDGGVEPEKRYGPGSRPRLAEPFSGNQPGSAK